MEIDLSPKEKEEFLGRFLEHGFGTMAKHEIEILVFKHLYRSNKFFNDKSNYSSANDLKISETKD
jgi:hypothetical protein